MISDFAIEKYKMLISIMPEDKAIEATEMLKEAMKEGTDPFKALPKINKFVMQNANVCIIKDEKELEGKDLTKYGAVIFDCNIKDVTDFSNCPKKMIFNESIEWCGHDFDKLPDISESIVGGYFDCSYCDNLTSLKGAPRFVFHDLRCPECENLKSLDGVSKYVGSNVECYCCNNLESLGTLEYVGGTVDCSACHNLKSFGNLKHICWSLRCSGCYDIETFGEIEHVGGFILCNNCHNLKSFGNLKNVGEVVYSDNCKKLSSSHYLIKDGQSYDLFNLPKDREFIINGDLDLRDMGLEKLPDLSNVIVKGDFDFEEYNELKSAEGYPKLVEGDVFCSYEFRQKINEELEKRKKQAKQPTLPPNGFGNDGR